MTDRIVQVPVTKIDQGDNVRFVTDEGLRESVRAHGIIQPVTLAKRTNGRFEVLFGHRRVAAAAALGLPDVPAIITDRPADLPRRQLAENLDRKAMDPIEIASVLRAELDRDPELTPAALAKACGRSSYWISTKLALLDLPEELQARVATGQLAEQRAHAIRKATTPQTRGRARTLTVVDDGDGNSRSVVVPLGTTTGQATLGIDRTAGTIDLVVQDAKGHGVFLVLLPEAAKLLGRRLTQAYDAVRPLDEVSSQPVAGPQERRAS